MLNQHFPQFDHQFPSFLGPNHCDFRPFEDLRGSLAAAPVARWQTQIWKMFTWKKIGKRPANHQFHHVGLSQNRGTPQVIIRILMLDFFPNKINQNNHPPNLQDIPIFSHKICRNEHLITTLLCGQKQWSMHCAPKLYWDLSVKKCGFCLWCKEIYWSWTVKKLGFHGIHGILNGTCFFCCCVKVPEASQLFFWS